MYWITGILGLAFAAAPFVFGYSSNTIALYTSLVLGAAVVVVSAIEFFNGDKEDWEYWAAGIAGGIAALAPFVFGFSAHRQAMWTSVVAGILLIVFAGGRLITGEQKAI
ncbi:MAG: SPW repeat protein [Patescibacteria group bacterium]|nr:SPW repeat protein [Patescibacteria group bacterium]